MTTDIPGVVTISTRVLPAFWHAELIPFGLIEGPPNFDKIEYPVRGPAAWQRVPLPLLWDPDGIAPHTEPVQVGTVDRFSVGLAEGYSPGDMLKVLGAAGCLDLAAPGFLDLVAAAARCAPYSHGHRLAGDRAAGFMLGVRADLADLTTDPAAIGHKRVTDFTVAAVTITTAPPHREGTYLRLDDIPHEYK